MAPTPRVAKYHERALQRGLAILISFSTEQPELSVAELSRRLELPKSTVVRLIDTLRSEGFLEPMGEPGRYRLGVRTFEVGSVYSASLSLEQAAHPALEQLAVESDRTANLAILSDGQIVHVMVVPPPHPIRYYVPPGVRDFAHYTALGKVLLAALPDEQVEQVLAQHGLPGRTGHTITDPARLRAQLAAVRQQGYAVDDQESATGVHCVAAPVRDSGRRTIAAVSVSGAAAELTETSRARLTQLVQETAHAISVRLGQEAGASRAD